MLKLLCQRCIEVEETLNCMLPVCIAHGKSAKAFCNAFSLFPCLTHEICREKCIPQHKCIPEPCKCNCCSISSKDAVSLLAQTLLSRLLNK